MKTVAILIENENVDLTAVTGVQDIFGRTNEYLNANGSNAVFQIQLLSEKTTVFHLSPALSVKVNKTFSDLETPDLIILPPSNQPLVYPTGNNNTLNWIRTAYAQGSEIAALCTGVFFLASTGLLDGKNCSTHWMVVDEFQQRFPKVHLTSDKVITDSHGIYTSGGSYSYLNLIIYLLEKYAGRNAAIWASKMFGIEFDRKSQSYFSIFMGQKKHEDQEILKSQEYIEANLQEKIQISELAKMVNIDDRNFVRRFKKATFNTPSEYVQRVKVEYAKRELEISNSRVTDIMYALAWNDYNSFNRIFKKHTSLTPTQYREKYRR